jgi:hypothetical protein
LAADVEELPGLSVAGAEVPVVEDHHDEAGVPEALGVGG